MESAATALRLPAPRRPGLHPGQPAGYSFLGFYSAPWRRVRGPQDRLSTRQCLELVGVKPVPRYTDDHNDIVTCFDSGSAAALTGFCAGIQHNSPVDSFADPGAR